jgi:hypothetical protein
MTPAATTNIAWKDDVTAAYGTESITQFPAVHVAGAVVSVPYDPRFDEFRYGNAHCSFKLLSNGVQRRSRRGQPRALNFPIWVGGHT